MQMHTDTWQKGGDLAVGAAPAAYMLAIVHQAMLTASFFTSASTHGHAGLRNASEGRTTPNTARNVITPHRQP